MKTIITIALLVLSSVGYADEVNLKQTQCAIVKNNKAVKKWTCQYYYGEWATGDIFDFVGTKKQTGLTDIRITFSVDENEQPSNEINNKKAHISHRHHKTFVHLNEFSTEKYYICMPLDKKREFCFVNKH